MGATKANRSSARTTTDSMARLDGELVRQLDAAEPAAEPVEAVFQLRPDRTSLDVDQVEDLVKRVVSRAEQESSESVEDVHVFRYLASFVARGTPNLIRTLAQQPEIAAATANRQPGDASIDSAT